MLFKNLSANENGRLCFSGLDTVELCAKYGTPLMLLDENVVRANARAYAQAMKKYFTKDSKAYFASKALSFKGIYKIVEEEGMGTDLVSIGELYTAKAAGFDLKNACFHGNNKTSESISYAIDEGVGLFVVDNERELLKIDKIAGQKGVMQDVLLRLSPGIDPHTHAKISTGRVDSKFGTAIATGQAIELVRLALTLRNVRLLGFHSHIGSQIFEITPFVSAAEIMIAFISEVKRRFDFNTKVLNLGGGFGARYTENDPVISYEGFLKEISDRIKALCQKEKVKMPDVIVEPGRSIVAEAGITLYTTEGVKSITGYKNYVSIDGGMTDNPRYTLYQSRYTVINADKATAPTDFTATIAGCCCESGDLIGEDISLARPDEGDRIAVLTTGAYNYAMSSNYSMIPRPPIVALKGGKDEILVRRETVEDILDLH
ncbi:MAG: diaminopimelate decarboxylase, partial [Clostridia bacterium]|nr:diaminopimelate decarboxylase [Clostridia bacterium]